MVKTKETPWTEQKMLYKDGNVDVYREFGWETWRRMTEDERAMWTEFSEATPAPISKEVIEFNEKANSRLTQNGPDPIMISAPIKAPKDLDKGDIKEAVKAYKVSVDEELEAARAECKDRGIKFAYNSKLETLRKKLADANNPE